MWSAAVTTGGSIVIAFWENTAKEEQNCFSLQYNCSKWIKQFITIVLFKKKNEENKWHGYLVTIETSIRQQLTIYYILQMYAFEFTLNNYIVPLWINGKNGIRKYRINTAVLREIIKGKNIIHSAILKNYWLNRISSTVLKSDN